MPDAIAGEPLIQRAKGAVKRSVKRAAERFFGLTISSIRAHGRQDWADIRSTGSRIETIFDVGANVGQSALKFRRAFPAAAIHCFEPASRVYAELERIVGRDRRIRCHRMALGPQRGSGTIYLTPHHTMNSLIRPSNALGSETVAIDTVDDFASGNGIARIDLLKIDAEGSDLDILRGAERMLSSNAVAFVLAEVGFHPGDQRHVLFDDLREFLMARGFRLFGIYDQTLEWSGEKRIRFANACFCNEGALRELRETA